MFRLIWFGFNEGLGLLSVGAQVFGVKAVSLLVLLNESNEGALEGLVYLCRGRYIVFAWCILEAGIDSR